MTSFNIRQVQWFLAIVSLVVTAFSGPLASSSDRSALSISLATNKAVYENEEPIRITFEVASLARTPLQLEFTSAQRFDVAIINEAGAEVWRWSEGRVFATMMGQEILGPDNPRLTYEAAFTRTLPPGPYQIKAWVTDTSRHFSATLGIEMR